MEHRNCIVVGAGQAGGWVVATLRQVGYAGSILLVGEESHEPYERPPLSKELLVGKASADSALLRERGSYGTLDVELRLGTRAEALDPERRELALSGGSAVGFDTLVLACGSRVRRLRAPGAELAGIHYLRTLEDASAIREELRPGRRLVVIGAGLIGLEVAAAARTLGTEVTVVEAAPTILGRVLDDDLAAATARFHAERGSTLETGASVAAFRGNGRVEAVALADGAEIPADVVVVGIGVVPNDELAAEAGLETDDGIVVDAFGRTAVPGIYACGDVARFRHPSFAQRIRLECWQHAQNQAISVARNIGQGAEEYRDVPWWWSDQFDRRLEGAGLPSPGDRRIDRGSPLEASFVRICLDGERISGATGWGCGRDMRAIKKWMAREARVRDPQALADTATELRKIELD